MASSAALTTSQLPRLRAILDEWRAAQPPTNGFKSDVDQLATRLAASSLDGGASKDVVVTFRTRPSLPNEAAEKFKADGGNEEDADKVEFCSGITVTSAEPGIFVAHTPGMKVRRTAAHSTATDCASVERPHAHPQELRGRPRVWTRCRQRRGLSEDRCRD